jgi:hypothetical protein
MSSHASVAKSVREQKERHPERFCPNPRCLWKTAKLNRETQEYEGGGPCPRHGGAR